MLEEEGPPSSWPKVSGRVQGERVRSEHEKQVIEVEIDDTIFTAADRVVRGPLERYVATVDRLTWSDGTVDALVRQKTTQIREELAGPSVSACAEMKGWAATGFHVLPLASMRWGAAMEAREKQVPRGSLVALLLPYEGPAEQEIVRRIDRLRARFVNQAIADEGFTKAQERMESALGERVSRYARQRVAPVIGRGRTSIGGTFVIRRSVGGRSDSCSHQVEVEVDGGDGGESGDLCLRGGTSQRLSGSCSGAGTETIELATPPDARRARVRLSDGRTVTVSVVRIPARDGGPAGAFIDAFRGYNPRPVSLQELGRDGEVLRTVSLREVHCGKRAAAGAPTGGPQFVTLATASTPSGEPLTIQGTLLAFEGHTEFSLPPQAGIRNSEASEEHGKPRQFQWVLSDECAPHPYSLLAGILTIPGASVLVRTSNGVVALTKVEVAASMHAEGPLFYGVYATPPTEIVIESASGSVLYTESLAAKATEEAEFCEGYA